MLDPLEGKVRGFIQREKLLCGERVAAAVSGGPDSTALLLILKRLCAGWDCELTAFHYNHHLRPSSQQDEQFVRDLCRRLEVSLEVEEGCVRQQAGQGGNLEDWARRLRYRALIECAGKLKAAAATGHTLDDQAETVLLKLVRGAGPEGLSGIARRRLVQTPSGDGSAVCLVRPLLSCRRQEVLDYLKRRGQQFRVDESNADLSLDRNWVRSELIPLLEGRLNPNLVPTLGRSAQLWEEAAEWLNQQAERILQSCSQEAGDLLLPLPALLDQPAILQRTALRLAALRMRAAGGLEPFSLAPQPARKAIRFAHIEALAGLLRQAPGRQVQLPGGLQAVRERDHLRLSSQGPTPPFCYRLKPPGELELKEVNKRLTLRECPPHSAGDAQARLWLDASPLTVRNRRPGDRYRPGQASPERKLKDLMAEQGIPNALRDRLIVVERRGQIIWVEGLPPHPDFAPQTGEAPKGADQQRGCFEVCLKLHSF